VRSATQNVMPVDCPNLFDDFSKPPKPLLPLRLTFTLAPLPATFVPTLPDIETDVSFEKLFWEELVSPSLVPDDQLVLIVRLTERRRVPRGAHQPKHLAPADALALVHQDRPWFEVRVKRVTPIAKVEHDMVAIGLLELDAYRGRARRRIGRAFIFWPSRSYCSSASWRSWCNVHNTH
jgi:hypothetical protein